MQIPPVILSPADTTVATVGLLRMGELMAGQSQRYTVKGESSSTGLTQNYWTLTPVSSSIIRRINKLWKF